VPGDVSSGAAALADTVRNLRRAGKLSQQELAKRSGVGPTTIKEIEDPAKARRRRTGTLRALSSALGKDPDYLSHVLNQDLSEDAENAIPSERALLDMLRKAHTKLDAIMALQHDILFHFGQAPEVNLDLEGHRQPLEAPSAGESTMATGQTD
jgi:transcriptional regulator with XRE-family HTH domain